MEDNKSSVSTAVKATSLGLSLPALAAAIPEPYAHWVYYVAIAIAAASMAATQIPIPKTDSSKLWWLYRALNFLASNAGQAANAAVLLRPTGKK